ncbi:SAV_2336 N-terminal domain-related protein, partial [Actinomadura kijaniata]|uniref:SAV_2336 N-terminal domain-related protein n=1 Tax=Actinomadura kijaniata TaxID=46161 RepID=UPI003F1A9341
RALHPPAPSPARAGGAAREILVPTAPMLTDPLGVQRALRPLKRRVPSRRLRELDEEATAAHIAETRIVRARRWLPVLAPALERWLSLVLVVDTGPTMRLWRPLARELAEVLLRQGAFHDIRVMYLRGSGHVSTAPAGSPRAPATLLDPTGRQAVLVLSDCSGPHWWNGRAPAAVRRWAAAGPTAILNPLPERLWRRSA